MRPFAFVAAITLVAASVFAQVKETTSSSGEPSQVMPVQTTSRFDGWSQRRTTLSSILAYGSFSVGGEDRFGPMFVLQYTPNRFSMPALDLFAGVLMQTGKSGDVNQGDFIPVQSYFAPYYSPFSNYRNDNLYSMPHFNLGLAFLGADFTFYILNGEVRPYVGLGGSLAFWSFTNQLSGALSPDVKAGLDLQLNNSLSGFAEVRRLFGVPNLVGLSTPRFDGLTTVAVGLSFAPRLR
jgi:hypothetical protein